MKIIFQYSLILFFTIYPLKNLDALELPKRIEISEVYIEPTHEVTSFYTKENFLAALPNMRKASLESLAFGKVWSWQKGIICLKNGQKIKWRSFAENFILFETVDGPVFYTDIVSQSYSSAHGKLTRIIKTSSGLIKIDISLD